MKSAIPLFFAGYLYASTLHVTGTQFTLESKRTHAQVREKFFVEFSKIKKATFQTIYYEPSMVTELGAMFEMANSNIAFFPYEFLFEAFSPFVKNDTTKCVVFFSSTPREVKAKFGSRPDIIPLVASVDVPKMVDALNETMGIRTIKVIAGPFPESGKVGQSIKEESPFSSEVFSSGLWEEWQESILDGQKKFDALVIMAPYGVTMRDGQRLNIKAAGDWLVENVKKPTIGMLASPAYFPRLLNFPVNPQTIAECAATQTEEHLNRGRVFSECSNHLRPWKKVVVNEILMKKFDTSKLAKRFYVEVDTDHKYDE